MNNTFNEKDSQLIINSLITLRKERDTFTPLYIKAIETDDFHSDALTTVRDLRLKIEKNTEKFRNVGKEKLNNIRLQIEESAEIASTKEEKLKNICLELLYFIEDLIISEIQSNYKMDYELKTKEGFCEMEIEDMKKEGRKEFLNTQLKHDQEELYDWLKNYDKISLEQLDNSIAILVSHAKTQSGRTIFYRTIDTIQEIKAFLKKKIN